MRPVTGAVCGALLVLLGPSGRWAARRGRTPELPVADERRVIAEALAWPTRGPQWISDRLAQAGLTGAPSWPRSPASCARSARCTSGS